MSYELAVISNPRPKRRKAPSKAQLAARRKFVAKFGRRRKKRKASPSTTSGVSTMAKRRKRRSVRRSAKGRFVKKSHRKGRKVRHVARRRRRSGGGKRRPMMGYVVGSRKVRRLKLNPRRRRYRRNPLGLGSVSSILNNQIMPAAWGALGGVALNLALSYLPLPDTLKTGWTRKGVNLVGALGIGWVAHKFVKGNAGRAMAQGALIIAMYDIVKAALNQFTPEIGSRLGEYEDVSVSGDMDGVYSPAAYLTDGVGGDLDGSPGDGDVDEMGAYMEGNLDGTGAYMEGF